MAEHPRATYTGALVADSVIPAWHEARHELPLLFAVYHAGKGSAADPRYTSIPQHDPATERGQPAVTR